MTYKNVIYTVAIVFSFIASFHKYTGDRRGYKTPFCPREKLSYVTGKTKIPMYRADGVDGPPEMERS